MNLIFVIEIPYQCEHTLSVTFTQYLGWSLWYPERSCYGDDWTVPNLWRFLTFDPSKIFQSSEFRQKLTWFCFSFSVPNFRVLEFLWGLLFSWFCFDPCCRCCCCCCYFFLVREKTVFCLSSNSGEVVTLSRDLRGSGKGRGEGTGEEGKGEKGFKGEGKEEHDETTPITCKELQLLLSVKLTEPLSDMP